MITRFILSTLGGIFTFLLGLLAIGGMAALLVFTELNAGLPSYEDLETYDPPTISRVFNPSGGLIDEFAEERRIYASIEEIPDLLLKAVISAEDKNFYLHEGYDIRAIAIVIKEMIESQGEQMRGASTITQQVVKNFLLSNERTANRKAREILLAYRIEQVFSKDEILELYLNEIFFGQNSYGITAAALTYFNKDLEELSIAEMAYLVGLPQQPSSLHPVRNRKGSLSRRSYVLREMLKNGYITQAQYDEAINDPFKTVQSGEIESSRANLPPRDYFTDEIRRQVASALGDDAVTKGGLQIRATIDDEMQEAARSALRNGLLRLDSQAGIWRGTGLRAMPENPADYTSWGEALAQVATVRDMPGWRAATVVRIDAGGAYVASEGQNGVEIGFVPSQAARDWPRVHLKGQDAKNNRGLTDMFAPGDVIHVERGEGMEGEFPVFNLRQVPQVEGAFMAADVKTGRVIAMQGGFSFQRSSFNRSTQALRQTGSSFKPFLYAAALEQGYTPADIFEDVVRTIQVGTQSWTPKNASGRSYGRTSMRVGMERSLNLLTLSIGQAIGMDSIKEMSERLEVYSDMKKFPANMLGSQETTLFNMVRAYAAFASGGEKVDLSLVDRVQDRLGETIYRHGPLICIDCDDEVLISDKPTVVALPRERVLSAVNAHQMTDMLRGVVERGTASRIKLPGQVAGKTGTTNNAQDVWFIGYTPRIVAGCYIGFDTPKPLGTGAGGGSVCGPVFEEFMLKAMEKYPGGDFVAPDEGEYVWFNSNGTRTRSGQGAVQEFVAKPETPSFDPNAPQVEEEVVVDVVPDEGVVEDIEAVEERGNEIIEEPSPRTVQIAPPAGSPEPDALAAAIAQALGQANVGEVTTRDGVVSIQSAPITNPGPLLSPSERDMLDRERLNSMQQDFY